MASKSQPEGVATPALLEAAAADRSGTLIGAELATRFRKPEYFVAETVNPDGSPLSASFIAVPEGMRLESPKKFLDEIRTQPERRRGKAELRTLDSLIDHANRLADEDSALFAWPDLDEPALTAVFDYHERRWLPDESGESLEFHSTAAPRFGQHRAVYPFPLSVEWQKWQEHDGAPMQQQAFAEFIEDRLADIGMPAPGLLREPADIAEAAAGGDFGPKTPTEELADLIRKLGGQIASPSRMVELSRGLTVHLNEQVKGIVNISNGEAQITYIAQQQDNQGQPLKVPNLFLINIPVFAEGAVYQIAVRLRYRVMGGSVTWFYQMYRVDRAFHHAFREACARAAQETGLPLYYGKPEE